MLDARIARFPWPERARSRSCRTKDEAPTVPGPWTNSRACPVKGTRVKIFTERGTRDTRSSAPRLTCADLRRPHMRFLNRVIVERRS